MNGGTPLLLRTPPTLYLAFIGIPIFSGARSLLAAFLLCVKFHLELLAGSQFKSVFGFWLSSRKCVSAFHPLVMPGVFSTTLRLGYSGGSHFVKIADTSLRRTVLSGLVRELQPSTWCVYME